MTLPVPRTRKTWILPAVLFVLAQGAAAHEFWIAPSRYEAAKGVTLELGAAAGTGFRGERKPWSPDHAVRYELRGAKAIDLGRAAVPGEMTWTRFAPSDDGGAMVAFESGFLPIELPAAPFEDYLKAEGLDAPLATRRAQHATGPGRERYRRCAKAWLAGTDASRATVRLGMPLELVPDAAPGAATTLGARVLLNGKPLPGALVKAWRMAFSAASVPQALGTRDSVAVAWQGRSDRAGHVTVPVRDAGEWLVSVVHMEPCREAQADWESTWASLTFARPAAGAAGGASARDASARSASAARGR